MRRIRGRRLPADAARDQQRVRVPGVRVAARGDEREPVRHRDRAGTRRDELGDVGRHARAAVLGEPARGAREHLERPGDVEDLRLREAEHHDAVRFRAGFRSAVGFHGSQVSGAGRVAAEYGRN